MGTGRRRLLGGGGGDILIDANGGGRRALAAELISESGGSANWGLISVLAGRARHEYRRQFLVNKTTT